MTLARQATPTPPPPPTGDRCEQHSNPSPRPGGRPRPRPRPGPGRTACRPPARRVHHRQPTTTRLTSKQKEPLMAADNHASIVGNLAADPELRFTNNGTPVANLRVAVTHRPQDKDGTWRDGET